MNLMMPTRQSEDTGTKTGMGWMRTGVPCLCHTVQTSVALSIKNFFSNNYTYGIMSGVGKNTTMKIYIGVRINE